MNVGDDVGPRQRQQIVVATQFRRPVGKARTAIVSLGKFVLLHHRAHRAVEYRDARGQQFAQRGAALLCINHAAPSCCAAFASACGRKPSA